MDIRFEKLPPSDPEAIRQMSALASKIVKEHFDPMIGTAQNDYMIRRFQSAEGIRQQLKDGCQYYFICDKQGENIGYMAFQPREREMYLSKFYLKKESRGKGISKEMLKFLISHTQNAGLRSIVLNVNRNNSAVLAYEHLGFSKIREEKKEIGNGFIMDDYVYEYRL